ncbi:TIGR02452 family protein [bacterium]|nr:TIGR02452 family protein [bacterium]
MSHSRSRAAEVARHTVAVVAAGRYVNATGVVVRLRDEVEFARAHTVEYPPDAAVPHVVPTGKDTRVEVTDETTLAAARRLVGDGRPVAALNFASARHPGGGFLGGARAQEESLCRASALYECLRGCRMYPHHAPLRGGFYTNYAVYSPAVPVFKDDDGRLLDAPYPCAFVTAPAVNVGTIGRDERPRVRGEMAERVEKVLAVAAGHGHAAVVLGAWGRGVFKNDPGMIADLFRAALRTRFAGVFEAVVFAVPGADGENHHAFADRFAGWA